MNLIQAKIVIIGLGYVGLPLVVEFGKLRPALGFGINAARIAELQSGRDRALKCSPKRINPGDKEHHQFVSVGKAGLKALGQKGAAAGRLRT